MRDLVEVSVAVKEDIYDLLSHIDFESVVIKEVYMDEYKEILDIRNISYYPVTSSQFIDDTLFKCIDIYDLTEKLWGILEDNNYTWGYYEVYINHVDYIFHIEWGFGA